MAGFFPASYLHYLQMDNSCTNRPTKMYANLQGLWTCLLMCGYASARISAHLNIPPDSGTNGQDPFDTFEDISKMLQFGFLLGWFVGVFDQKRFAWLFHW